MKRFFIATALALTGILSGCDDDDNNKGSFKVTQDGTEQNVSVKVATLTIHDAETSDSGQGSHVLKIEGLVGEDSIKITISNWDFQEPPDEAIHSKNYYNVDLEELEVGESNETCMKVAANKNVCEGALIFYTTNGKLFYSFSNDASKLIIQVTACDGERASGNFNVTLANPNNLEEKIQISGAFKDLKYEVRHV